MTLSIATITARSSSVSLLRGVPGGKPLLIFPSLTLNKPFGAQHPKDGHRRDRGAERQGLAKCAALFWRLPARVSVPGGTKTPKGAPFGAQQGQSPFSRRAAGDSGLSRDQPTFP
jgi:hypothetical protein